MGVPEVAEKLLQFDLAAFRKSIQRAKLGKDGAHGSGYRFSLERSRSAGLGPEWPSTAPFENERL